jgi:hypothetical protein
MILNRSYTSVFIEEGGWTRYKQTPRANPANFVNKHGKKLGTLICSARADRPAPGLDLPPSLFGAQRSPNMVLTMISLTDTEREIGLHLFLN